MRFLYASILAIAAWSVSTSGLRCLKCDNARNATDCQNRGTIQTCSFSENVCQTEIRVSEDRMLISTMCKSDHACNNNRIQNPRKAWLPSQCNGGSDNSVCRCCCSGELCNENEESLMCLAVRRDPIPTQPLVCREPRSPINGRTECTNGTNLESVCTHFCNDGYELVNGRRKKTCMLIKKRPQWRGRTPTCQRTDRTCIRVAVPVNGAVTCSDPGLEVGTICDFTCNVGYSLQGFQRTTCRSISDNPQWEYPTPTCVPDCVTLQAPDNGEIDCSGSRVGSICNFRCRDGYELQGAQRVRCDASTAGASWSDVVPQCIVRTCDPISAPSFGSVVDCSSSDPQPIGRVCQFRCNEGYVLNGFTSTRCNPTTEKPEWNNPTPICEPTCIALLAPENGVMECSGTQLGDTCSFSCDDGYDMEGASDVTCRTVGLRGATWSDDVPQCLEPACRDLGEFKRGSMTCTSDDHNVVGTECTFECEENYKIVPANVSRTECVIENGQARWSRRKPCCSVNCPPSAKMDIVIAIDSSDSIKSQEWDEMINFVISVVGQFYIGDDFLQVAVFRYNGKIDKESQIKFGDYTTKQELLDKIKAIPKEGTGTQTGKALRHAREEILNHNNRPDVGDMVWLLTDGLGKDVPILENESRLLREDGVEIVAIGIVSQRMKDRGQQPTMRNQLETITGDRDLVLEIDKQAEESIGFEDEFIKLVADKICEVSCE